MGLKIVGGKFVLTKDDEKLEDRKAVEAKVIVDGEEDADYDYSNDYPRKPIDKYATFQKFIKDDDAEPDLDKRMAALSEQRKAHYPEQSYEELDRDYYAGHTRLTLARRVKDSAFGKFLKDNPGLYGFMTSSSAVPHRGFMGNCIMERRVFEFCIDHGKTLADAWDALCDAKGCIDKTEACMELCMFAEYAFAKNDRMKLAKVFIELLLSLDDGIANEPFDGCLMRLIETNCDKGKAISLRNDIEAWCDGIPSNDIDTERFGYEERQNMPKPLRERMKSSVQRMLLASAYLVVLDAIICDRYSHGKLLMFWMMLTDYMISERQGTIIGEYGSNFRRGEILKHVSFSKVENPFR